MSGDDMSNQHTTPPFLARTIRRFSVLIILAWLAVTLIVSLAVPSLEQVEKDHSVSLYPSDAPSIKAMKRIGEAFKESDSTSVAMIVLEGQQRLGDDAHQYYDRLIRQLEDDRKHVQHIQNFWGDPLTASAAESGDGKAAYVQLSLAGNLGQTSANESAEAVRDIVKRSTPPPGVKTYVTGPAPLAADLVHSGNRTVMTVTVVSMAVIFVMLLLFFRSLVTVILMLLMVGIELAAARGTVAFLGDLQLVGLTTFAINLLVALAIAAGTDYAIFFFGRYQEARNAGEDPETAFYTTYRGVARIVLASGLTIAGAVFLLSVTRLPVFQTMGVPCAVGMVVAVAVALTLIPAALAVGSRFGLFEPKQTIRARRWRRIGTAIVRWPGPILAATVAIALIGLLTLPGYKTSYIDSNYIPKDFPSNQGLAAVERHFPHARMAPDILMIEADHDMRNPADFLVLNKLAKAVFAVPGISRVQGVTRPEGNPIDHTSIPFLMSLQSAAQVQVLPFMKNHLDDLLKGADELTETINILQRMYDSLQQLADANHRLTGKAHEMAAITAELRDHTADFDDFFRPIRNYFYWEPHCFDIPICWSLRSLYDSLDSIDELSNKLQEIVGDLDQVDTLVSQSFNEFPQIIATMTNLRTMMLSMQSTMSGILGQMDETSESATTMGKAFDASKNDDSFYLPPEVFKNPDFMRIMDMFLSPDGKAARFIISHRGNPATPEGMTRVGQIKTAAEEALKGTPLENATINLAGTSVLVKDVADGSKYDLLVAGVAALCLIFIIMLIMTRSFIAALVIVGTVALSLGASFGLSVLVWQYIIGVPIHWMVLAMSVIILLAVGSDYNLLLVSRMKEELAAGINTGIIRAMGGTGKVVTSAGLVFAFTMASLVVSDLRVVGQIGTTICLGLLFDTLVVRAFMTPSIAALLGRWFWWPQTVRPRPASQMLRPFGPRPLVRALLQKD
jgi:RND superfamily putative drug exporter